MLTFLAAQILRAPSNDPRFTMFNVIDDFLDEMPPCSSPIVDMDIDMSFTLDGSNPRNNYSDSCTFSNYDMLSVNFDELPAFPIIDPAHTQTKENAKVPISPNQTKKTKSRIAIKAAPKKKPMCFMPFASILNTELTVAALQQHVGCRR